MVTDTAGTLEVNSPRPQMVFQDPYGSISPWVITATRAHSWYTTARSWEMNR